MQFDHRMTKHSGIPFKNTPAQTPVLASSPRDFFRQSSESMDSLIRKNFQKAQSQISSPSVCLIAVGGYGRAELAPYSDIDLLLLYPASKKESLPPLVEKILYPLWDLGLDVSCSSRSINECLKMAQSNLHIKTSLIDGRYLDGEYEFFRNLYRLFTKNVLHQKVKKLAGSLADDLRQRYHKYEDPAYALEPNIKEGEGGLRDFQSGRWIIRAKYKTDRWDSILFPDHSRLLEKSVEFLWTVRNQLHILSGRRQDDLTFEFQERIAPILGFPPGPEGVEEMMRQYHLSAQRISSFAQDILDRALHDLSPARKAFLFFQRQKINDHFAIGNGEIHLLDPVAFKRDPTQLMSLFAHCQRYQAKMDFRVEEAVMEALPFVDDLFRSSQKVNQTFFSILRKGNGVATLLKKMHELGLLIRYIPEFSEIAGRIHYDLYHVHPVDIHSLLAVEELEKLKNGSYENEAPLLTQLARGVEQLDILFLVTLLHDIGKSTNGDHSLAGAEMVKRIGARMGLSPEECERAGLLVSQHLLMVKTALRRDLHDEQVILRFATEIKSFDQLKMLYLLTFADIKAVGGEAWTSWKNSLLMELFLKTSHFFERNAVPEPLIEGTDMMKRLRQSLPPEIISEYEDHLPGRYLSCYSSEQIAHHIEMARSLGKGSLLVEWEVEKEIQAKVTVCTRDRYGLFSRITGAMFLNRLNILEAQIHTWGNGIALDTFWIEDSTKEIERRLLQLKKDLKEILDGKASLKGLLLKRKESNGIKQKVIPRVAGEVKINNQDSDFFTILEVTGENRLGVLYEMTEALTDFGCDIHFARISTLGNRIVDVFYIQDTLGEKMAEKNKEDQLRKTVLKLLTPSEEITSYNPDSSNRLPADR